MDIGLREWLIIVGIIVIGAILFDGWRRMRGSKNRLKLRLDRTAASLPDDDGSDPELLGPARVVDKHLEPSLDEHDLPEVSASPRAGRRRDEALAAEAPGRAPAQPETPPRARSREAAALAESAEKPAVRKPATPPPAPQEVLVINVIARDPAGFRGPALLQSLLESGLRYGDMDIFHRHESMAGNGEVLFSMANALKPGTFDLDNIDDFSTRAVSFFLSLPGPRHPKQAFDLMVAAARKLSHELGGELKDEQRSVLTAQTIEHYRQRIVEFERRALMHKR